MKSQLIGKDLDAGKHWGQEKKGTTEDETIGWHHWLNGHEFEQTLGDSEGQGSLVYCSPWGSEESDMTEWLKNNKNHPQEKPRHWNSCFYLLSGSLAKGLIPVRSFKGHCMTISNSHSDNAGFSFLLFKQDSSFFWFCFTVLHGMWDLSSLTRDGTYDPCTEGMES